MTDRQPWRYYTWDKPGFRLRTLRRWGGEWHEWNPATARWEQTDPYHPDRALERGDEYLDQVTEEEIARRIEAGRREAV